MGQAASLVSEAFPPQSKFSVDDIPDLAGTVAIVTGANTGVGKETAKALLAKNAKVYIAARNHQKAENAILDLQGQTGKEAIWLKLDLGDLESIKHAAEEFTSKEKELHMLYNNAGVMFPPLDQVTTQDYDLQFGTNVLGHFYFTKLLMPVLVSTAKSTPSGRTRVVHTSSSASTVGWLNFNTFKDGSARRKCFSSWLYAQSKLGNVIIANEFARRYASEGVISCSCNPGNLRSDLWRYLDPVTKAISRLALYPTHMGALTQLWAGTSEAGLDLNGQYLIPWARIGNPNSLALDETLGQELWRWLEEQVETVD